MTYPYYFAIEFENGQREVVSGNALRKRNGGTKLELESVK